MNLLKILITGTKAYQLKAIPCARLLDIMGWERKTLLVSVLANGVLAGLLIKRLINVSCVLASRRLGALAKSLKHLENPRKSKRAKG